jgi:MoaA/NifB/PqqE/SkfB family radical SAM enzyme
LESIYYVMSWACHRRCKHCYEEKFRPYVREELDSVLAEAVSNFPRIVDNFPERMTYLDLDDVDEQGAPKEKVGRIVLSGGESLVDPVRENVTYKVIERLRDRYANNGGVKIVVQTTGDLLTDEIIGDLLSRGVWMISVAGVDDFHVGMEGAEKQAAYTAKLTAMFEKHGMQKSGLGVTNRKWYEEAGPRFSFFGATPDSWIGKLWPRGRAWKNNLSTATLADNFCNRWSGGLNFLRHQFSGSEVSVEPDGSVYPCCIKTKLPVGNLLDDNMIDILDSLVGVPAFEAISMGHPERAGIAYGWSEADFVRASLTKKPDGTPYQNLCIGCDKFHEQVLGPVLQEAANRRRAKKGLPPLAVAPTKKSIAIQVQEVTA